ncbi:probable serine/threonine-protein kinase clkA isoform X2 [Agrilus planipennis]|uniref:Probable serine/threonine-protein kinase clkA isoform X2 n=1 Tax=Agrilus planipennis TaxID=224129 RepID=A0A1W4WYH3_AGRPL|nr:probable serine/threonine-protein kinase clkA isoform X2 [Agrilus planipennis]
MLHWVTTILLLFLCLASTPLAENLFKNSSRNNLNNNKVNDPFQSLILEMKKYIKDCKLDPSSEELKEKYGGVYMNNNNKRRSSRNSKEINDDDASFSSRQYYLTKAHLRHLDNKNLNNSNYTTQQEHASAYGRNWNMGGNDNYKLNNFGENLLRNGNYNNNENRNRNDRRNGCKNDQNNNSNNYDRNGPDRNGNGYSNQNNRQNSYNSDNYPGQNYNSQGTGDFYNRRSDGMDRGYSSNMETILEPSSHGTNRNYQSYQNQQTRHYGTMPYPAGSSFTSISNYNRQSERQDDIDNRRSSGSYYIISGLQPPQQVIMARQQEGRYPRSSGNLNDWNKSEENVECIARCILGYLDVLDEDKTPTEMALIKWLQDHENDSNNRIKALRKIRRCYARLSTSDIEESCEFSRTLCHCLEIDIKNLTNL